MIDSTKAGFVNRAVVFFVLVGCLLAVAGGGCGDDDDDGSTGSGAGNGGDTGAAGSGAGSGAGDGAGGSDGAGDEKGDACQCYIDLGIVPDDAALKADCVSNISDACVSCSLEVAAGASCANLTESDFNSCAADCAGMISAPETSDECKSMISAFGESPVDAEVTDCLCDNCLNVFAPCMVNRGCMSIILCIGEYNCDLAVCMGEDMCGPLFTEVGAVYPNAMTELLIPVSLCNSDFQCRPDPVAGAGGGGGTGGAGGESGAGAGGAGGG